MAINPEQRAEVPCILEGISHEDYHSDIWGPSLSRSIARILLDKTPRHAAAAHPRLEGSPPEDELSPAKDMGSLVHGMLLGVGPEILPLDFPDWRTKDAQKKRDGALAEGKLPVLLSRYREAEDLAELFLARFLEMGIDPAKCHKEVTMLWEEGGVLCRCRCDLLDLRKGCIYDLKIVGDASRFTRSMLPYGLDIQHAAYTSALDHCVPDLAGRSRLEFLVCETAPPYDILRVRPAATMRDLGRQRWQRAVTVWGECLASGEWPGYGPEPVEVEAPAWALQESFSQELARVGEPAWATEE